MAILFGNASQPTEVFSEGMVGDVLKSASNVDVDAIKDVWNDADKGIYDKAKAVQDHGVDKVANRISDLDQSMNKHRIDNKSIIARSRNSVLQFPIYVTQTLRVNEAQIIAGLFERVYTTLVQTVLSQNPILDEDEANNLVFLKKFHTNLKESADFVLMNEFYQPIDEIDSIMKEAAFYSEQISPICNVEFRRVPTTDKNLIMENARLMNEPLTGFRYLKEADNVDTTTDRSKKVTVKGVIVSEKELEEMARERAGFTDREWKTIDMSARDIKSEVEASMPGDKDDAVHQRKVREAIERRLRQKHDAEEKLKRELDKLKADIKDGKIKNYDVDPAGRIRRLEKSEDVTTSTKEFIKKAPDVIKAVDAPKMLRDGDIKKINNMLPYTIEATFRIKSNNGGLERDVRFIIGIKSVMHLIRTQDLAEDLRELVTGNIKSLQKVRYKTGEIDFMDYMFNIKGLKADAAKHINYNKRWINTLKRLGEYDKTHGSLLKKPTQLLTDGHVPIPNGTLVLAQTDVTTLTNQTGIDLSVVSNAKKLAKTLFLIGIVIVDGSAGSMRILFPDSDNDWDVQSLAAIDAELAKTDNSQIMKELNKMVNR